MDKQKDDITSFPLELCRHIEKCKDCVDFFEFSRSVQLEYEEQSVIQKAPPYFYSRLKSKMESYNRISSKTSILSKQRIQYALISAVLVISVFLGIVIGNSNSVLYGTNQTAISVNEIETTETDYLSFVENELFEEQYFKLIGHEE